MPVADPVVACAGVLHGAPGPRSAAVLAAWSYQPGEAPAGPVGPLTDAVDVIMAGRRLEGWALWCQLSAIARLIVAWTNRPPRGDAARGGCEDADPALARRLNRIADAEQEVSRRYGLDEEQLAPAFVAAEVALACGLSRAKATQLVTVARALLVDGAHPRVGALLAAGLLDWAKVHLLATRLARLDRLVADHVEARLISDDDLARVEQPLPMRADPAHPGDLLPQVTRWTLPQLREALEAVICAVDPDGSAERARRARADRYLSAHPEDDGMARIEARAGADAVAAVMTDLDAAAAAAKAAGDLRTRAQISLDEFLHRLTHGRHGAPAAHPDADPDTESDADPDAGDVPAAPAGEDPSHPADTTDIADAAEADVEANVGTGAGRSTCACGRAGAGRGAGLAVGLTMPLATWLGLAADPGQLAGYGPVPAALARQIAADAARDRPTTTTWRCVITDDGHGSVVGIGRPIRTPQHDPPPRLGALVRAAEPTCVFPGCTVPSARCDLDHRIPYPAGATCSCTLQPLCRTHHRLKTTGLISVRLLPPGEDPDALPGTLEWTTRAGRTYRRSPALPVPPALAPALARIPALLAQQRSAQAAELRDLNARLRAAQARQHHRRLDAAAAGQPRDGDDTIQRPPASIDDDPAPPPPLRPLETWNDSYDTDQAWPCSA